jgi:pleiotropic regulator 1
LVKFRFTFGLDKDYPVLEFLGNSKSSSSSSYSVGHNAIINSIAVNADGVLVSGADNGTMNFWDWRTGYNFQRHQTIAQPGSIDSEAGIFAMTFDHSGTRLITTEADKTIKIYKEDDGATEESHPVLWKPEILRRKKY